MAKPMVIIDPGHGGEWNSFYNVATGAKSTYTRQQLRNKTKQYFNRSQYRAWKAGRRSREPRYYYEIGGKKLSYGDPGAKGTVNGKTSLEKNIVLSVARALKKELETHCTVHLTRNTDGYIWLGNRAEFALNKRPADGKNIIFVSLHADISSNANSKGFKIFRMSRHHLKLAKCLQRHYQKFLEQACAQPSIKSIVEKDFFVLKGSKAIPGVLVEMGFLSNRNDCQRLSKAAHQKQIAHALRQGIDEYFGVKLPVVQGKVLSAISRRGLPLISVTATGAGGTVSGTSKSRGFYSLALPDFGDWKFTFKDVRPNNASGAAARRRRLKYKTKSVQAAIQNSQVTLNDVFLSPKAV